MSAHNITRPLSEIPRDYSDEADDTLVAVAGDRNSTSSQIKIDRSTNKRNNDWGPWVAVACILGSLAFGACIVVAIMVPQLIDARAESKAAPALIKADIAEREARIAQDDISLMRLELAKRGIVVDNNNH